MKAILTWTLVAVKPRRRRRRRHLGLCGGQRHDGGGLPSDLGGRGVQDNVFAPGPLRVEVDALLLVQPVLELLGEVVDVLDGLEDDVELGDVLLLPDGGQDRLQPLELFLRVLVGLGRRRPRRPPQDFVVAVVDHVEPDDHRVVSTWNVESLLCH